MKNLKKYLLLFSFLFLFFIPKTHAQIIIPSLPSDIENNDYPYIISYDNSAQRFYLTYCKGSTQTLTVREQYQSGIATQIGTCWSGNAYLGYAYRRNTSVQSITQEQINNYNFEISGDWGNESQASYYGTNLSVNSTDRKIITWQNYNLPTYNTAVITGNTDIYNYDKQEILLTQEDYEVPEINEPTYEVVQTILDNGNVKLNFTFNDYNDNGNYGFTISNEVSGEEYGITNPFDDIFPNIIPFQNNYEIEVSYDTYIYITLATYTQVEGTQLYIRDEIYTDIIDINNVVFNNVEDPYFSVESQTQNSIRGTYKNTKNGDMCYYKDSNSNIINAISCREESVYHTFNFNGYIDFYIEDSGGNRIYDRKINVLGEDQSMPYIVYDIEKQDFYNVVKWKVENRTYDPNMEYRFSNNNGNSWSSWATIQNNENVINIFENSVVIIEISNQDNTTIYDTKAINVINNIATIKTFNNTTNNFIDKFISIFRVNDKILKNVNIYWDDMKNSKLYLIIFTPFVIMLICAIIYLIRRK